MKKIIFTLFLIPSLLLGQNSSGTMLRIDLAQFQTDQTLKYLKCGNDSSFNTGNELTIEAWIKPDNSDDNQKIAGKTNLSFNSGYIYGIEQLRGYTEVFNPSNTSIHAGFIPIFTLNDSLFWTHLTMTFVSGDSMRIYINGKKADAVAVPTGPIGSNNDEFIIGIAPWDEASFHYFGELDEMRVWNRALDSDEITSNLHRRLSGSEAGLVAYYDFDQNSASTVHDLSINGNHGSMTNMIPSNWLPSTSLVGDSMMSSMENVMAIWNGKGITDPRFTVSENGLSVMDTILGLDNMIYGHDNAMGTNDTDLPMGAPANAMRTERKWYVNSLGSLSPDLIFNLENASGGGTMLPSGEAPENYALLWWDQSGMIHTVAAASSVTNDDIIVFENVAIQEGFYALAVADTPIYVGKAPAMLTVEDPFTIYPNPSKGHFILEKLNPSITIDKIEIKDLTGKIVYNRNLRGSGNALHEFNLGLPSGIYHMEISSGDQRYIQKLSF